MRVVEKEMEGCVADATLRYKKASAAWIRCDPLQLSGLLCLDYYYEPQLSTPPSQWKPRPRIALLPARVDIATNAHGGSPVSTARRIHPWISCSLIRGYGNTESEICTRQPCPPQLCVSPV